MKGEDAMGKTANYGLPKWEKSDFIKMDDFNDAFGKIESALSGHDDTLNTKADTSAVTAVQQEVAAAREANCLVKLAGPLVTTTENGTLNFDLSQVDMTKIAALFVVFSIGAGSGDAVISANGATIATVCSNSFSTSAGIVWVMPLGDKVACFITSAINKNNMAENRGGTCETVAWASVNTLTFSGYSYAGATATLFAVKK